MKINLLYQPSIGWISHVKMQAVQLLAYLSGQIACWKNACTERRLLFLSRWYQQDLRIQSVWPGARPSNGVSKPMSWDCSTWCGFLLCKYTIWQGWAAGWCCEALSSSCPMLSPASALPLAPYLFLVFKFLIAVQVSTSKLIFPFPEGDGYVCLPVSFACPAYLHPSLTVSVGSILHAPISFTLTLCSVISLFLYTFCTFPSGLIIPGPTPSASPSFPLVHLFAFVWTDLWWGGPARRPQTWGCSGVFSRILFWWRRVCSHCCSEGEETDTVLEANESLKTNPASGCTALYGHGRQAGVSGCRSEASGHCFSAQQPWSISGWWSRLC